MFGVFGECFGDIEGACHASDHVQRDGAVCDDVIDSAFFHRVDDLLIVVVVTHFTFDIEFTCCPFDTGDHRRFPGQVRCCDEDFVRQQVDFAEGDVSAGTLSSY